MILLCKTLVVVIRLHKPLNRLTMSAPVAGQQQPGSGKVMVRTKNKPEFDPEFLDNTPVEEVILATGGYDHTIKFWQAHTGERSFSFTSRN